MHLSVSLVVLINLAI